jgi:hypothetical protein
VQTVESCDCGKAEELLGSIVWSTKAERQAASGGFAAAIDGIDRGDESSDLD